VTVTVHNSIADIAADDWNRLCGTEYPFLRHEFLNLAEQTRCVSKEQGWTPRHLSISEHGRLRAAMPLYEKSHSWGEFVFDWAWANAYEQAGLSYYPKLVSAVPFTPAPSCRLLLADADDSEAAGQLSIWQCIPNAHPYICCFRRLMKSGYSNRQVCSPGRTVSFTGKTVATTLSMISWRHLRPPNERRRNATDAARRRVEYGFAA